MSAHSQTVIPVLGSALLEIAEAERGLLRDPLSCGLASIDNLVLDGGFRYGEIISIAGATATGKTLVRFSLPQILRVPPFEESYWVSVKAARVLYRYIPPFDSPRKIQLVCVSRDRKSLNR